MFIKIFFLFLSFFYLNLACNSSEVLAPLPDEKFSSPVGRSKRLKQPDESPSGKRQATSPKVGISPYCQSKREEGCEDPRVLKNSLEYGYGGKITTTTCDAWHDRNLKILEEILKKNLKFFEKKNVALLGIQFVYEHEDTFQLSEIFDINTLFISGGKGVSDSLEIKTELSPGRIFKVKSSANFLETSPGSERVTKQMRAIVLEYYSTCTPKKLKASALAARHKEANFVYCSPQAEKKSKKKVTHPNSPFERGYLHSEQAILVMLARMPEVLGDFLNQLPAEATIHQLTLLIVSKNQMCRQCGTCYFIGCGKSGIVRTALENYIQKFPEKDFKISSNSLKIFTQVSGLNVFDNINLAHRLRQLLQAESPVTHSERFVPHVAQRCLPNQLTRKQKNELKKQKISDLPKFRLSDDDDGD